MLIPSGDETAEGLSCWLNRIMRAGRTAECVPGRNLSRLSPPCCVGLVKIPPLCALRNHAVSASRRSRRTRHRIAVPAGGTPCAARSASRCRNPPARTDQVPISDIMSGYVPSSCLIRCFTATSRSWPASCHRLTCCIPLDKPEAFHRRRGTTTQTRRSFACSRTELWILVNESPDGRSGIDPSGLTGVARRRGRR